MAAHWSRELYSIYWRDAGTGRMRVSLAKEKDSLLRRLAKVWHKDMDAALYAPSGERLPLTVPDGKPKGKAKKRKARPAKSAPALAAA